MSHMTNNLLMKLIFFHKSRVRVTSTRSTKQTIHASTLLVNKYPH